MSKQDLNIKQIRENLKLSQAEFAEKLGVRQATISDWENGKFKPSKLARKAIENLIKAGK